MNTYYLIRHGQDHDNVESILNGHRDRPLTETGITQAISLGNQIKELDLSIDHVLTSPLNRAYVTAGIVSAINSFPTPLIEPLLIERDFGVMTGKKQTEIVSLCSPDIIQADTINYFLNPQGAETFPDLLIRAKTLLDKLNYNYSNQNIILATHGDFGKMLFAEYYHLGWRDVLVSTTFGNSEMIQLSADTRPGNAKKVIIEQQYQ